MQAAFGPGAARAALIAADVVALATVPSVLAERSGRPQVLTAWILALFALPFAGPIAWWWFGRIRVETRRRRRKKAREEFRGSAPQLPGAERAAGFVGIVPAEVPCGANNVVTVFEDGRGAWPAMEAAIAAACTRIRVQMYIWEDDATGRLFAQQLAARAKAGIAVHVLVDGFGAGHFRRTLAPMLRQAGVVVAVFEPVRFAKSPARLNLRNHRKIIVVDDHAVFVGGMNVGDDYALRWHDVLIRLEGPAVGTLDEIFRDDWYYATRQSLAPVAPVPGRGTVNCAVLATGPDGGVSLEDVLFQALTGARERILLTTPYFVPTPMLLAALRGAALRGVDVRVLMPDRTDWPLIRLVSRSFLPPLLNCGVRVFEYRRAPLHQKALVIDQELVIVGSPNVDMRSLNLNFEVSCVMLDKALNTRLAAIFANDLEGSQEVRVGALARTPWAERTIGALAQLFTPLL